MRELYTTQRYTCSASRRVRRSPARNLLTLSRTSTCTRETIKTMRATSSPINLRPSLPAKQWRVRTTVGRSQQSTLSKYSGLSRCYQNRIYWTFRPDDRYRLTIITIITSLTTHFRSTRTLEWLSYHWAYLATTTTTRSWRKTMFTISSFNSFEFLNLIAPILDDRVDS